MPRLSKIRSCRDLSGLRCHFSVASTSNSHPWKHPFAGRYKFVYFGFRRVLVLPSKSFLSLQKFIPRLKLSRAGFPRWRIQFRSIFPGLEIDVSSIIFVTPWNSHRIKYFVGSLYPLRSLLSTSRVLNTLIGDILDVFISNRRKFFINCPPRFQVKKKDT